MSLMVEPTRRGFLGGIAALVPCHILSKVPVEECGGIIAIQRASVVSAEDALQHLRLGDCAVVTIEAMDSAWRFKAVPTQVTLDVEESGGGLVAMGPTRLSVDFFVSGEIEKAAR